MKSICNIQLLLCLISLVVLLISESETSAAVPSLSEMVRMQDGTRLMTDVYLPEGKGPWPVILMRTPYPRMGGTEFTLAGYAVVIQSTRGRYGSDASKDLVFKDDAWGNNKDGYDCVEWVAKQKWCNGKIGSYGGSALGITQYLMAGSAPPDLKCQHVIMAPCSLYNQAMYQNGAFREEQIVTWLKNNEFNPESLQTIMDHPAYDDMWKGMDLSTRFSSVKTPVLHIAGWYDTFQQGNIDCFIGFQYHGGDGAKGNQKLVIGPYSHGGFGDFEEAKYPNPLPPFNVMGPEWFDIWLKGNKSAFDKIPAVSYYTMGALGETGAPGNIWRTSDVWPVPSKSTPFYLHKDDGLSTDKPYAKSLSISYTFDPDNPVPTVGGNNLTIDRGPMDQRKVEGRNDVRLFTSEVLDKPIEVTGRIKVKLWASSSAKDTDFTAKLTDVYPDGRSMLVCDGIIRARYRKSLAKPEILEPEKIYEYEIDLWSTSIIFNKGHRIRLAISSSNYPRFDVNKNTGEDIFKSTRKVIAKNRIYFDKSHPSALYLPVIATSKK